MSANRIQIAFAKRKAYEERLMSKYPNLTNDSGIYFFTREDTNIGLKFAYVGQAKHLVERIASHLLGFKSHIDRSLKNRKLDKGEGSWHLEFIYCSEQELDEKERSYIKLYGLKGYQLYNNTSGGQDNEKIGLFGNDRESGYRKGVVAGYQKCREEVKDYFKYLFVMENEESAIATRKMKEFEEWIELNNN